MLNIRISYCVRDDLGDPFVNFSIIVPSLDYVYFHQYCQRKGLMLCYCDKKLYRPNLTIVILFEPMSFA